MKSKRSRLLIMAIADKLNEKEMEIIKVKPTQKIICIIRIHLELLKYWMCFGVII